MRPGAWSPRQLVARGGVVLCWNRPGIAIADGVVRPRRPAGRSGVEVFWGLLESTTAGDISPSTSLPVLLAFHPSSLTCTAKLPRPGAACNLCLTPMSITASSSAAFESSRQIAEPTVRDGLLPTLRSLSRCISGFVSGLTLMIDTPRRRWRAPNRRLSGIRIRTWMMRRESLLPTCPHRHSATPSDGAITAARPEYAGTLMRVAGPAQTISPLPHCYSDTRRWLNEAAGSEPSVRRAWAVIIAAGPPGTVLLRPRRWCASLCGGMGASSFGAWPFMRWCLVCGNELHPNSPPCRPRVQASRGASSTAELSVQRTLNDGFGDRCPLRGLIRSMADAAWASMRCRLACSSRS